MKEEEFLKSLDKIPLENEDDTLPLVFIKNY